MAERPLDLVPAFGERHGQSCSFPCFPCFFSPLCLPLSCPLPASRGSTATVGGRRGGTHSMRRARSFVASRSWPRSAVGTTDVLACCCSACASVLALQPSP